MTYLLNSSCKCHKVTFEAPNTLQIKCVDLRCELIQNWIDLLFQLCCLHFSYNAHQHNHKPGAVKETSDEYHAITTASSNPGPCVLKNSLHLKNIAQ
jgi:hypothetical protein